MLFLTKSPSHPSYPVLCLMGATALVRVQKWCAQCCSYAVRSHSCRKTVLGAVGYIQMVVVTRGLILQGD